MRIVLNLSKGCKSPVCGSNAPKHEQVARWLGATPALKAASLQTPVLTNRKYIRGIPFRGKQPQHCNAQTHINWRYVDVPGIGGRIRLLPGEVSAATRWLNGEVSRGHSTNRNERSMLNPSLQGLTKIGKDQTLCCSKLSKEALTSLALSGTEQD